MAHRDEEPQPSSTTRGPVVAAMVAVAVVLAGVGAFAVLNRPDKPASTTTPTPKPSTSTPSSPETSAPASTGTTTATTPPAQGTGPLNLADLATGSAPAIAYGDGRDIHLPDGSVWPTVLPEGAYDFALMGSGFLAAADESVSHYSSTGAPGPRTYPIEGGLATSPKRSVVAWAGPGGTVTVVQNDGDERYDMNPLTSATGPFDAVTVTSEDCLEGRTTDGGCAVFVNTKGADPQTWVTSSHGIVDRFDEDTLAITAWGDRRYAGITSISDTGTCSAVRDSTYRKARWKTCDYRVLGFSPDEKLAYATDSYGDGFGDGRAAILRARDGSVLTDLVSTEESQVSIVDQAWEDPTHVLLVTYTKGAWAIVRLGSDGSLEYAVPPRGGTEDERPFLLRS